MTMLARSLLIIFLSFASISLFAQDKIVNIDTIVCGSKSYTLPSGKVVTSTGFYNDMVVSANDYTKTLYNINLTIAATSVGDPIVNETFGSGAGFGSPLPGGSTSSLGYQQQTCPTDGHYAIVNFTSGCWPSDVKWHTATDHTGNTSGYFMLINASYDPSDFYIRTVNDLCAGSNYQFSAWLLNMCSAAGNLPNITFTIEKTDGTILAKYNTGDIPIINPLTWKNYDFYFTTPAGVSTVVLRMRNNAQGGVGNDVGLDDIVFRPIGPNVNINVLNHNTNTIEICNTSLDLISQTASCYATNAFQWQQSEDSATWKNINGATKSTYTTPPHTSGKYYYRLSVAQQGNIDFSTCRVNSDAVTVMIKTPVIINKSATICKGSFYVMPSLKMLGEKGIFADTLFNIEGCDSVITNVDLSVDEAVVHLDKNIQLCEGQTKTIDAGNGFLQYLWNDGTTAQSVDVSKPGTYTVAVNDAHGCESTDFTTINELLPLPENFLNADTIICSYERFLLTTNKPFITYLWSNGSSANETIIKGDGKYFATVTDKYGCAGSDTINIRTKKCLEGFFMPNAFTPNEDGNNDLLFPKLLGDVSQYSFAIYNRWGGKVFESNLLKQGWDGNLSGAKQPAGIYIWKCTYMLDDKSVFNEKGTVLLVR